MCLQYIVTRVHVNQVKKLENTKAMCTHQQLDEGKYSWTRARASTAGRGRGRVQLDEGDYGWTTTQQQLANKS